MILTTTATIEGYVIECYRGLVSGESIAIRGGYESIATYFQSIRASRDIALADMCEQAEAEGANAVIGIHTAVSAFGGSSWMEPGSIIYVSGTAVRIERLKGGEGEHAHRKP